MGEGASDVLAFLMTGDPVMGAYATGNALGIRRYPYDAHPLTYQNTTGEVRSAGVGFVTSGVVRDGWSRADDEGDPEARQAAHARIQPRPSRSTPTARSTRRRCGG